MLQNLRLGIRVLIRKPAFTLICIITLAQGIGANTAIFSVIHAVLLRPLPYKDTDRLVMVWATNPSRGEPQVGASEPDFIDFKRGVRSFQSLAAYTQFRPALSAFDQTEKIYGALVTPDFFSLLGVQPMLGRNFSAEDAEPGKRVVLLSHGLWLRRFGGDPAIIGNQIQLNNTSHNVIGILPDRFHPLSEDKDLYRPMKLDDVNGDRSFRILPMIGRLKESATIEQAQAEMEQDAKLERKS